MCVEQTAEPGFRLLDCISSRSQGVSGGEIAAGALIVVGAVGLVFVAYAAAVGSGLSHTH